jgi:hypothetical protein
LLATLTEQLIGRGEQSARARLRLNRQRAIDRTAEYDLGRPLLADRHQIAAQPGLHLARACPRPGI